MSALLSDMSLIFAVDVVKHFHFYWAGGELVTHPHESQSYHCFADEENASQIQ